MTKAREEQTYDLRTLEHLIRKGTVDPKDYQAFLKTLPDSALQAEYIEVYEEPDPTEETTLPESGLTFRPAEPAK